MNKMTMVALAGILIGACATVAGQDATLAFADQATEDLVEQIADLKGQVDVLEAERAALADQLTLLLDKSEQAEARLDALEMRSPGLGVYDAAGTYLGVVVRYNDAETLGEIDGELVVRNTSVNRTVNLQGHEGEWSCCYNYLLYEAADCVGQPLMLGGDKIGALVGETYYSPSGQRRTLAVQSTFHGPTGECSNHAADDRLVFDAVEAEPPFPIPIVGPLQVR